MNKLPVLFTPKGRRNQLLTKNSMIRFFFKTTLLLRVYITIGYLLLISVISLLPRQDLPPVPLFPQEDKLIHFCMHLGLGFLLRWISDESSTSFGQCTATYIIALGWGIFLEFMQLFMRAGRHFSIFDMVANLLGIGAGMLLFTTIKNSPKNKNQAGL